MATLNYKSNIEQFEMMIMSCVITLAKTAGYIERIVVLSCGKKGGMA